MSSASVIIDAAPKFAFLALPPPPMHKKKCIPAVAQGLPAAPRAETHYIATWAESVLPGTPAPMTPAPMTPLQRLSASPRHMTFRRPSLPARVRPGSRRQSISSTRSRVPSASFLNFADTPTTPFINDAKIDLTALGYGSAFLKVSVVTPMTPEMYKPKPTLNTTPSPTQQAKSGGIFKRFQSITQIRGKMSKTKAQAKAGKARPVPAVSDYMSITSKKRAMYTAASIERQKRDKYAAALPQTVVQEAQLRQVMEGGSIEHNMKQIMEEKARREGVATKVQTVEGRKVVEGVQDVWRDGQGGIWWDQEEEVEFAHLLGGKAPVSASAIVEQWVSFEGKENDTATPSAISSCRDSDLHESYVIKVDDSMDDLRVISAAKAPTSARKTAMILAVPSRPTRTAKHLRKPEYLLDQFPLPPSPRLPYPPPSPRTAQFIVGSHCGGVVRRKKSRNVMAARRKRAAPPPLQLVPPSPCFKFAVNLDGEDDGKREFLADTFEPAAAPVVTKPSPVPAATSTSGFLSVPVPAPGLKKKSSFSGLTGLFKKSK